MLTELSYVLKAAILTEKYNKGGGGGGSNFAYFNSI